MKNFDQLLAAHYVRVHRAALGFVRDEQEARELAQESLLKAHRARDRYDEARPFYPWLHRIVRNTCFDAIARRKHRARTGLETERVASHTPSSAAIAEQRQTYRRLDQAMSTLSESYQAIIQARHFEDLSYAEIAERLDIPEGTVMSRLYRARKALADAMEAM